MPAAALAAMALSVICTERHKLVSTDPNVMAPREHEQENTTNPPHLFAAHRPGDLAGAPSMAVGRRVLEAIIDKVGRRVV